MIAADLDDTRQQMYTNSTHLRLSSALAGEIFVDQVEEMDSDSSMEDVQQFLRNNLND